jgi:hypothetical protein
MTPMARVASLMLLAVLFSSAAKGETIVHTNLAGNASCAAYLKARSQGKTLPYEIWLSGYLTGLATYDRKINKVPGLEKANGEAGALLLDSYCKTHPLDSYQIAAREMARSIFYRPGS